MDPKPLVLWLLIGIIIRLSHTAGEKPAQMNVKIAKRRWVDGADALWISLTTAPKIWQALVSSIFETKRRQYIRSIGLTVARRTSRDPPFLTHLTEMRGLRPL